MGAEEALTRQETALIVAHPDDETIAAGGLLPRMLAPTLVYITDGAPLINAIAGLARRPGGSAVRRRQTRRRCSPPGRAFICS